MASAGARAYNGGMGGGCAPSGVQGQSMPQHRSLVVLSCLVITMLLHLHGVRY